MHMLTERSSQVVVAERVFHLRRRRYRFEPRLLPPQAPGYTEAMPSQNDLLEALRQVEDPELGMDVVDLGLVYEVEVDGPKVKIIYSLTSMGCPAGPLIAGDMERVSREVPGVEDVELELVFDPPWTPDKMSDDAKFILGFG
jgi:metal-sulfur cluster biosynthetic enzyme